MKHNIYYDIEKFSELIHLVLLDEDDLGYEYNILLVIKHKPTGRLFFAADAGCSCPTPFEDYYFHGVNDTNLEEICVGDSWSNFLKIVDNFPTGLQEKDDLVCIVKKELNANHQD
jgi:hypothetical protein